MRAGSKPTMRAALRRLVENGPRDPWKFAAAIGRFLHDYVPCDLACLAIIDNHPDPHVVIREPAFRQPRAPGSSNGDLILKIGGAELPQEERSMVGHAAATGRAESHGDVTRARFFSPPRKKIQSEVVVPVVLNGEVLGVLNCESAKRNAYSRKDRAALRATAQMIAPTLGELLTQKGMRSGFAEVFRQVGDLLASVAPGTLLEDSDVLNKIAAVIGRSLQCHTCAIWLLEARGSKWSVRGAFGEVEKLRNGGGQAARLLAMDGMRPVNTGAPGAILPPESGSPRLVVPLLSHGRPVGVIEATDKGNGRRTMGAFTPADQALLQVSHIECPTLANSIPPQGSRPQAKRPPMRPRSSRFRQALTSRRVAKTRSTLPAARFCRRCFSNSSRSSISATEATVASRNTMKISRPRTVYTKGLRKHGTSLAENAENEKAKPNLDGMPVVIDAEVKLSVIRELLYAVYKPQSRSGTSGNGWGNHSEV